MFWQLLIVLIATAASAEESEEGRPSCRRLVQLECQGDEDKPQDFPGTGEELEHLCKFLLKFADCTDRVLSSCEVDDTSFTQYLGEVATTSRRVCKEDSLIRPALVAILPCLKENHETIVRCHRTFRVDINSFADALKETGVTDIQELGDSQSDRCLNVLFATGCAAATTGLLCGDIAKDVVINLMQGFDTPFEGCPESIQESLPTIAELLETEAAKLEAVENTIKRKK